MLKRNSKDILVFLFFMIIGIVVALFNPYVGTDKPILLIKDLISFGVGIGSVGYIICKYHFKYKKMFFNTGL